MNTVLICSPSNSLHGGVENIIKDLCNELPRRGWEPRLALGRGSRFNNVEAYRQEYPDLPIIEIDGTRGTRASRLESLTNVIRKAQPDVVLSARIFDAYEAVSALKAHQRGPRLAVTIQAYEAPYFFDARLYRNNIDFCVTAGDLTRTAVTHWCGLQEERVVSIPNGVNLPIAPVDPRRFAPPLRIGYVGRLEEGQKRISDLVPFLRELDSRAIEYTLDIIGTGPAESQLKHDLSAWVDRRQVTFHGWQDRNSLYKRFYPALDCLIHFAHTEGVPLAPGEALMHGVVPVISQFTGLKTEGQFVHETNALTFAVGDVQEAANQTRRLVGESGLLERLSAAAMSSQTGKRTLDGSMDAWADALDRCLELPPAIGPVPPLNTPADGRLTRAGLSSRSAQRVRDLFGRRHIHSDPGSEWPPSSGLMTEDVAAEIMRFAVDYENTKC